MYFKIFFIYDMIYNIIANKRKVVFFVEIASLIVLVAAIAAAFIFKANTGLVAMTAALILARCAGITDKWLVKQFDSNLFIMLLGVMYLFCIAQENKTLDLLSRKVLALCKGRVKLFPLIMFLLAAVLSAIGPGLISVSALVAALSVALAKQSGIDPIKLLPFGTLGAFAGGLSPITPSGIVAIGVSAENGITGLEAPLMIKMALTNILYAAILYFFVFKWQKEKNLPLAAGDAQEEKIPPFSAKQWMTLGGIVVVAVLATVFSINVGLASFAVAVVLTVFKAADEGAAMKRVPWNTLIMIAGVGILISLVTELGGIDLLSKALSSLMGPKTASAIMTVLAGVMSWVSSASGVVMPTLIPTVPGIAATMQGANVMEIVVGLCIGAHLAALSPLSSCGGLMLSAYSSSEGVTAKDRNRVFAQLFAMSAAGVAFGGLLALLGLYR